MNKQPKKIMKLPKLHIYNQILPGTKCIYLPDKIIIHLSVGLFILYKISSEDSISRPISTVEIKKKLKWNKKSYIIGPSR